MHRFRAFPNREVRALPNGATEYRYYNTPVVTLSKCRRTVTLSRGEWDTEATKRAINDALTDLGVRRLVYQHGGDWYLTNGTRIATPADLFIDGMTVILR